MTFVTALTTPHKVKIDFSLARLLEVLLRPGLPLGSPWIYTAH